jgi:hypothetical protein
LDQNRFFPEQITSNHQFHRLSVVRWSSQRPGYFAELWPWVCQMIYLKEYDYFMWRIGRNKECDSHAFIHFVKGDLATEAVRMGFSFRHRFSRTVPPTHCEHTCDGGTIDLSSFLRLLTMVECDSTELTCGERPSAVALCRGLKNDWLDIMMFDELIGQYVEMRWLDDFHIGLLCFVA